MNSKELSLIIPAFCDQERLFSCLDSAVRQTTPAALYEIIIIDDASPISLRGVACHFQTLFPQHSIIYTRNTTNAGRAVTRNNGIQLSKGRILFFLDVDNLLTYNTIENIIEHFKTHSGSARANITSNLVPDTQSSYIHFFDSRYIGRRLSKKNNKINPDHLHERYFATDAVAVEATVIDQIGPFDTRFTDYGCEDEELGIRLANEGFNFSFAKNAIVFDSDIPTIQRACERMIVYAEKSVPKIIDKHPRYVKHCMMPFLEQTPSHLNFYHKVIRYILLYMPFPIVKLLRTILVALDSRIRIPGVVYYAVLAFYYTQGFKRRV